jgi:hypothetical protein
MPVAMWSAAHFNLAAPTPIGYNLFSRYTPTLTLTLKGLAASAILSVGENQGGNYDPQQTIAIHLRKPGGVCAHPRARFGADNKKNELPGNKKS